MRSIFCLFYYVGSLWYLQWTAEVKSLWSISEVRERAWLLDPALLTVKFKGNSNIGLSSQVEAMAFAWSALIIWGLLFFFLALTLSMWPWTSHLTCRAIGSFIKLKGIPGHFLLGPSLWWKEMLHCWDFGRTHANTLIWSSEKNPSLYGKNYKTQRRKEFGYKPTHTLPFLKCYLKESVFWDRKQTGTKELTVSREARIECSSLPRLLFKVWYASVKSSLVPPPLPNEKTVTKYLSIQCLSMWFYLEKKSL